MIFIPDIFKVRNIKTDARKWQFKNNIILHVHTCRIFFSDENMCIVFDQGEK